MKQIIRLSIFLLSLTALQAQPALKVEPARVQKTIQADLLDNQLEESVSITVKNPTAQPLQIQWDQVIIDQPNRWEISLCDERSRPTPFVRAATPSSLQLQPGESVELVLSVRPNGQQGLSTVEVPFSLLTDPGKIVETAVFQIEINDELAPPIERPGENANDPFSSTSLQIYPNPATDRFYVSTPAQMEIGRIEIRNMLGRTKKVFDNPAEGMAYGLSDLPEGIYLVALFDRSGKVLRTLRLLKRDYRP